MGDLSTFYLTQGVLGVTVLALAAVSLRLWMLLMKAYDQAATMAESRRLEDKQTLKDVTAVMQQKAQADLVLAEKIESTRSTGRRM